MTHRATHPLPGGLLGCLARGPALRGRPLQRFDAELTLLHVYQVPGFTLPEGMVVAGADVVTDLLRDIDAALARWRDEALRRGARAVHVAPRWRATPPEIARYADDQGFDLVVIGTHGRTGIAHALLGSTAEKVVRYAHCPVLTVRAAPEDRRCLVHHKSGD